VCTVQGYPLVGLPGANVFFSNEDATTGDGLITCKPITSSEILRDLYRASKLLSFLIP